MLPQDWLGGPTWPLYHCLGTPQWPTWRHVKTFYCIMGNVKVAHTYSSFVNGRCHLQRAAIVYEKGQLRRRFSTNRPLALRSHVTNASFKQWVGILLVPKIDRAHKNYLTRKIWEETHLREIFYGTLIFQQSSMICIGRHVGGHTLALQHGGQNYFLLISC